MQDSKLLTERYVPENEVSVETVFVGVVSGEKVGAERLLDVLCTSLANIEPNHSAEADSENYKIMEKLIGKSTDGESANTGNKGGLSELLKKNC